jgi:hypothetical protein
MPLVISYLALAYLNGASANAINMKSLPPAFHSELVLFTLKPLLKNSMECALSSVLSGSGRFA